jgi:hypothetical protein
VAPASAPLEPLLDELEPLLDELEPLEVPLLVMVTSPPEPPAPLSVKLVVDPVAAPPAPLFPEVVG